MSWFSKKLKKITNTLDPVGKKIREGSGGSYGDPLNYYDSKPKTAKPYQEQPNATSLFTDPGTGGPTMKLGGGGGGRTYQGNPFANQMAQAAALRSKPRVAPTQMPPTQMPPTQVPPPNMGQPMTQPMGQPPPPQMQMMGGQNMMYPPAQGQKRPMMAF